MSHVTARARALGVALMGALAFAAIPGCGGSGEIPLAKEGLKDLPPPPASTKDYKPSETPTKGPQSAMYRQSSGMAGSRGGSGSQ
jgi:hypothetical protein